MILPARLHAQSHMSSTEICTALGIGRQHLQQLADRERLDQYAGVWGLEEVKLIATRLIVTGNPTERATARTVVKHLIAILNDT